MKKPTAKKGAKGDAPFMPRVADPSSGKQMMKGRPVDNAGPSKEPPRVKDPVSGQPLKKGSPVDAAYSGTLNQKVGETLRSAGSAAFFPPRGAPGGAPAGGKGDPGGKIKRKRGK